MPFPPAAFIIGAQRSGTTSLSALLDQHPAIVLSTPKEPDFFSVNWGCGLDWYRAQFRRPDAFLIDASVSYTMAWQLPSADELPDVVPRLIHQVNPRAKFVYLVRDPAERCNSAYWHEVRTGRERRPLREAVEQSSYYVMASYYHRQIKPFLRFFPLERFLIVRFEDFANDPLSTARSCCRFFGLEADNIGFRRSEPKNQSFLYKSLGLVLQDTVGEERMKAMSRIASSLLPQGLQPYAKRVVMRPIPGLTAEDQTWLAQYFADDAEAFERLTGVQVAGRAVEPAAPKKAVA
jgi:hypothetical protein